MWIDTHAHLTADQFADDVEAALQRAQAAKVRLTICVGDDVAASQQAVQLADRYDAVVAAAGVHPHNAARAAADDFTRLRALVLHERVVAVGEVGLDFHYDFSPVSVQQDVFRRQVRLAKDVGLPLIVHSRAAEHAVLDLLEEEGADQIGGVLHCFWGDADAARRTLDLGFYIGVGGPVTFKNTEDLREIIRTVPVDRLLMETDAPYLAPVPHRGKRNEPAYTVITGRYLAGMLGMDVHQLAAQTTANAVSLFRLGDEKRA